MKLLMKNEISGEFLLETTDYKGRVFDHGFHVARSPSTGPGWYVFGRCATVSASVIKMVAQPNLPRRRHPHYNVAIQRGWLRMYEAQAVAKELNAIPPNRLVIMSLRDTLQESHQMLLNLWKTLPVELKKGHTNYHAVEQKVYTTLEHYKDIK